MKTSLGDLMLALVNGGGGAMEEGPRGEIVAELRRRRDEWGAVAFTEARLAALVDDPALLAASLAAGTEKGDEETRFGLWAFDGWRLIDAAAAAGSVRVFEALRARGGAFAELGEAPRLAASYGRVAMIAPLLAAGCSPLDLLCWGSVAFAGAIAPHVTFDAPVDHLRVLAKLDPRYTAASVGEAGAESAADTVLDRLVARGLDLATPQDPDYADRLAREIGQRCDGAWLHQLQARGYRVTAQRLSEMLDAIRDDARGAPEVAFVDVALAEPIAWDAPIVVHWEEDNPPKGLFDFALRVCSLAALQRLVAAGLRPTSTKVRRGWRDGPAKLDWLRGDAEEAPLGPLAEALELLLEKRKIDLDIDDHPELRGGAFIDLAGIERCTELRSFTAEGYGTIRDLTALAKLPKLRELNLMNNDIRDVTPLAGLTKLTSLNLASNPVSDIGPLARLTKLETLYLAYTPVADLTPLRALSRLDYLTVGATKVVDLTPIADLPLATLVVDGENLNEASLAIAEAFQERGCRVYGLPEKPKKPKKTTKTDAKAKAAPKKKAAKKGE